MESKERRRDGYAAPRRYAVGSIRGPEANSLRHAGAFADLSLEPYIS
jgi:hypothetical protein